MARHPDTTVLALETGVYAPEQYENESDPRATYNDYFASPFTMFPVWERSDALTTKAIVLGLSQGGESRAYPVERLQSERVVNDTLGGIDVVVIASSSLERRAGLRPGRGRLLLRGRRARAGRTAILAGRLRGHELDRHRGLPRSGRRAPPRPGADPHVLLVRLVRHPHRHDRLRPGRRLAPPIPQPQRSPRDPNGIRGYQAVGGHDCQPLYDRLSDDETVERITVQPGQLAHLKGGLFRNR